jgi:hypothetical protein
MPLLCHAELVSASPDCEWNVIFFFVCMFFHVVPVRLPTLWLCACSHCACAPAHVVAVCLLTWCVCASSQSCCEVYYLFFVVVV